MSSQTRVSHPLYSLLPTDTEQYYFPAASAYHRERAADNRAVGVEVVNWRHALDGVAIPLEDGRILWQQS